jgi:uncharacterized protein YihD (DUF1040 family)
LFLKKIDLLEALFSSFHEDILEVNSYIIYKINVKETAKERTIAGIIKFTLSQ